jgi:molybdopterin/thiamine biosynthesis adenylyltransferase
MTMKERERLRYSRQIMLPGFGLEGQERLRDSTVLVVGLGGLGSPAAMYLAASGVGRLLLADFDAVDLSNLQRQILHTTDRIGLPKADSACLAVRALNPEIEPVAVKRSLGPEGLAELVGRSDLVLDCSDNFATRFAVNAACVAAGRPLVSGAAIRLEGQVAVFPGQRGGPCYQCLYPLDAALDETCSLAGVLAPVVGIVGSIQATEAIKLLAGLGQPLTGRLLLLDAAAMEWRTLNLPADPACPICGGPSGNSVVQTGPTTTRS